MAIAEKVEKASSAKNVGQLDHAAVEEISEELRPLLADCFALYLKTKNFHWHMTGKISATIICFLMSMAIRYLP